MSAKKNGTFTLFKTLILALAGASIIIFLITASVCSLFGYSLWSWINVLRFMLGGAIVCMAVINVYFLKSALFKKSNQNSQSPG